MKHILAIKKNIKNSDIFYITSVLIFVCFFAFRVEVSASLDDISYLTALDNTGYFDYFIHRYNGWSGRVMVESIAVILMPHLYFMKLFMAGCYVLLSYSVWRITLADKMRYQFGIPLVIALTLLITPSVLAEAVYWAAGAFNYLVPLSLGLFSVCVLMNQKDFSKKIKIFSLLSLSVSSNSEQCAIILLAISLLTFTFIPRTRLSLYSIFYYIVNVFFSLLLFLSPGSHKRFSIESEKFMPNLTTSIYFKKYLLALIDMFQAYLIKAKFFLFFPP